mgnify:CR=1 FL=1
MIDFILPGTKLNLYNVLFVGYYNTDVYQILSESDDDIKKFLINDCKLLQRNSSNKTIHELFEDIKKKTNNLSFSFARGRYFYIKSIILVKNFKELELELELELESESVLEQESQSYLYSFFRCNIL